MWAKVLYDGCLDLVFPPRCAVCNVYRKIGAASGICSACVSGVRLVEEPVCSICGTEVYAQGSTHVVCGECLKKSPPYDFAISLFRYGVEIRALISRLKYNKDTSVVLAISELVKVYDFSLFDFCDYIVPVPLHKKRIQKRGFNQALLLAKMCFGRGDRRINVEVLRRTRNTVPQVSLGGRERRKSLKNVFRVNPLIDISGCSICLIDDVYTTGTTVSACAKELLAGGALQVVVLTFARVEVAQSGR